VKPKVLDLYALVKFKVGNEARSQVVPVTLSIRPPVRSTIVGALSGAALGWLARNLNNNRLAPEALFSLTSLISVCGVLVMAAILAIVLSRQDTSKGFVTIEDFYGAFVVGAILGYTGTQYFEASLNAARGTPSQ